MEVEYNFETAYLIFEKNIDILFQNKKKPLDIGIACSGGPDSMLVLHFLAKYKIKNSEKINTVFIIHIIDGNYIIEPQLKGTMIEAIDIIKEAKKIYDFKLIIKNNEDVNIFYQGKSIETTCHILRKRYFKEITIEKSLDSIITGHTKTDQIEHFFISIARRSSLKRISGMEMFTNLYTRPLLFMNKSNTTKIMNQIKKKYVNDPCNINMKYLRNNIRKNLIPILNIIDSRFENSIIEIMNMLKKQQYFIEKTIQLIIDNNDIYNLKNFLSYDILVQYKIIEKILYNKDIKQTVSIALCEEIIRFINNNQSKIHKIGIYSVIKTKTNWNIL